MKDETKYLDMENGISKVQVPEYHELQGSIQESRTRKYSA